MTAHPDRVTLVGYIDGEPGLDRLDVAAHVAECWACRRELEELQKTAFLVRDANVFDLLNAQEDERDRRNGQSDVAGLQNRLRTEAERAETFFGELMRLPIEQWPAAFATEPRQRTEGMVLRLLKEVEIELKRRPMHALLIIDVAESIAGAPNEPALHRCLGDCWKQRANAFRHLGRYPESLDAAEIAEAFYRLLPVGDFDIGQALYTRAVTLYKMTHYSEALSVLAAAAALLRDFGDSVPLAKTLMLDAAIHFDQSEVARAEKTWIEVVPMLERCDDRIELARVRANLAVCSLRLGLLKNALDQAQAAVKGFAALHMNTECIRSEWTVAVIQLAMGEHDTALALLQNAAASFKALGMAADAGFVKLDITEELLRREEWNEAATVARELAELFIAAGVTIASVTALSFLRTAVEGERATPVLVQYIRDYVTADDPARAFSPPS